jgi:hypothetical protein
MAVSMELTVIPRRNVMKNRILAIVGLAMLAAVSASAQDMKTNLIKVPFAFMVGDKTLPPGEYRIQTNHLTRLTTLLTPAGAAASRQTFPDGEEYGPDALDFLLVGDTWVLQRVRVHGYAQTLVPSKFERTELAKLKSTGRRTLIASSVHVR